MHLTNQRFKQEAVIIVLSKIFRDDWFCVSKLKHAATIAEVVIPKEKQQIFDAMHCIHYNTMPKEFREDLAEIVIELFKDYFETESHKVHFVEIIREIEYKK